MIGNDIKDLREEINTKNFVVWLRAIGVVFILLCHYTAQSGNVYGIMSAQFFNIGNYIFFVVSGYCFGIHRRMQSVTVWYKRRIRRIFIPYEIMLFVLLIANIVTAQKIDVCQWLVQVIGLQGWNGVYGAIHTWFITSILGCYFVTPILERLRDDEKNWGGGFSY